MKNGKRRNQIMTELTDAEINNLTQQQFKRIDVILETVLIKSTSYTKLKDELVNRIGKKGIGLWNIKLTIKTLLMEATSFGELKKSTLDLLYRLRELYVESK